MTIIDSCISLKMIKKILVVLGVVDMRQLLLKGLSLELQNHVNFSVILHTSSFIVSNNLTVDCYQPKGILIVHSA